MMIKIKCPECGIEGSMSLLESSYEGPYKCWKCRALFTIRLKNNRLESCEPLSQEDFEKQQEIAAMKNRLKRS